MLSGTTLTANVLYPVYVTVPVVAVPVAPEPPPPVIAIVGAELYSLPGFVTVIPVTTPPETAAVAVAPKPPPPGAKFAVGRP